MDRESESLIINGEPEIGDEFYEKIEAPKFVDLTAPDPFQPGEDRSWFCLRVGCDQNHDEEMDSEEIYKNFVLRVMAARSPNIRLRKALCRKDSGLDVKCPRTVPAKPSKSRVTRMALISSISKRIVDTKVKVKPLSKKNATPKGDSKRASIKAKALTTPQSKKQLANPQAFRSVRNPRTTANAASNSRTLVKKLVFDSPKKAAAGKKISVDLNTPLKALCAEMRKLEITSGKKQALGYNRTLHSDNSRKKFRGKEVKSKVFDGLNYKKEKVQHAKSSKCLEKNKKENNLQKNHGPVHSARVVNDMNDTEIEEIITSTSDGVCSTTTEIPRLLSNENNVEALTVASRIDSNSVLSSEERSSGDDGNVSRFQPSEETVERNGKGDTLNFDNKGNDSEEMESDDKENASAYDDNRNADVQTSHIEHKIFCKHKNLKGNQEITTAKSKRSKESSAPASNGAQCLKLRKPKPTNPKPFRLRTDERGILKESNLEKKMCSTGGNSQEKHQNAPLSAKCLEQKENQDTVEEDIEMERQNHQPQSMTYRMKIGKERMGRKVYSSIPQRHTISSKQKQVASQQKTSQDNSTPKSENSSRKSKSPSVRQLLRLKEETSTENEIATVKTRKLGTITETSPPNLRATETSKQRENGASGATKASARKPKTVPKEPNFHSIHTPKSCTRRVVT